MTANVLIAAVAALTAGYLARSYHGSPQMLRNTLITFGIIGLGAFALAFMMADGSC